MRSATKRLACPKPNESVTLNPGERLTLIVEPHKKGVAEFELIDGMVLEIRPGERCTLYFKHGGVIRRGPK